MRHRKDLAQSGAQHSAVTTHLMISPVLSVSFRFNYYFRPLTRLLCSALLLLTLHQMAPLNANLRESALNCRQQQLRKRTLKATQRAVLRETYLLMSGSELKKDLFGSNYTYLRLCSHLQHIV